MLKQSHEKCTLPVFRLKRVLGSASITVNMHYFCSWAQDLLLSQADQGFLAHQSTAI